MGCAQLATECYENSWAVFCGYFERFCESEINCIVLNRNLFNCVRPAPRTTAIFCRLHFMRMEFILFSWLDDRPSVWKWRYAALMKLWYSLENPIDSYDSYSSLISLILTTFTTSRAYFTRFRTHPSSGPLSGVPEVCFLLYVVSSLSCQKLLHK